MFSLQFKDDVQTEVYAVAYQFHNSNVPRRQELKTLKSEVGQLAVFVVRTSQLSLGRDNLNPEV